MFIAPQLGFFYRISLSKDTTFHDSVISLQEGHLIRLEKKTTNGAFPMLHSLGLASHRELRARSREK